MWLLNIRVFMVLSQKDVDKYINVMVKCVTRFQEVRESNININVYINKEKYVRHNTKISRYYLMLILLKWTSYEILV